MRKVSASGTRNGIGAAAITAAVVVVLSAGTASAVPPTPSPYPTQGGSALAWSCNDRFEGDPAAVVGTDCAVTAWGTDPEPVVNVDVPAPEVTTAGLTDDQYNYLSFAAALIVFLVAALVVGSWAK